MIPLKRSLQNPEEHKEIVEKGLSYAHFLSVSPPEMLQTSWFIKNVLHSCWLNFALHMQNQGIVFSAKLGTRSNKFSEFFPSSPLSSSKISCVFIGRSKARAEDVSVLCILTAW